MTRLRMDVQVATPAARLVALTSAQLLTPADTAKELYRLSRAVRSMLEAREPEVALVILENMVRLVAGVEGIHAEAVLRKIADLQGVLTWKPSGALPNDKQAN